MLHAAFFFNMVSFHEMVQCYGHMLHIAVTLHSNFLHLVTLSLTTLVTCNSYAMVLHHGISLHVCIHLKSVSGDLSFSGDYNSKVLRMEAMGGYTESMGPPQSHLAFKRTKRVVSLEQLPITG